jgi:hypothetical protein
MSNTYTDSGPSLPAVSQMNETSLLTFCPPAVVLCDTLINMLVDVEV